MTDLDDPPQYDHRTWFMFAMVAVAIICVGVMLLESYYIMRVPTVSCLGDRARVSDTGSMRPTIIDRNRTCLLLEPYEYLQGGDVYIYNDSEGEKVAHRLIWYDDDGKTCIFKGDAVLVADVPISCERIMYRVRAIEYNACNP